MTSLTLQSDGQRVLYLRHIDPDLWAALLKRASLDGLTPKQAILKALEDYAK